MKSIVCVRVGVGINAVKHKLKCHSKGKRRKSPSRKSLFLHKGRTKTKECLFCGGIHAMERKLCPAIGIKCIESVVKMDTLLSNGVLRLKGRKSTQSKKSSKFTVCVDKINLLFLSL